MLKTRILTALVIIPIILAAIYWVPYQYFPYFVGIVVSIAGWEWAGLSGFTSKITRGIYVAILWVLFIAIDLLPINQECTTIEPECLFANQAAIVGLIAVGWWMWAIVWILQYQRRIKVFHRVPIAFAMIGILVLIPFWFGLTMLNMEQAYQFAVAERFNLSRSHILLFIISIVALADTAAYFVGRKWGKRKLASNVSPGKTWEGLIGALIIVGFFAPFLASIFGIHHITLFKLAILVLLVVIFALVGDLFESLIKRLAGVKDSGTILPGHGGILDRIDSYTAAIPIFMLAYFLL